MNEEEFEQLAAGDALHALSDGDGRRYADALAEHPNWSAIADRDAETAALLAEGVPEVVPPGGIRQALLARIAVTPQGDAEASSAARTHREAGADAVAPRRRWRRAIFALAACLVLIAGVGIGAAVLIPQFAPPASVVALERIEAAPDAQQATVEVDADTGATAHWSASVGSVVLVTHGLAPLDDDQTYQLWLVRGEEPLPAGIFETDAGAATALLEGTMHEGDVIAVTVEEAGGSPTGLPTTDPIIVIPTA